MATYSFNLLLLTLACGGELHASDLFTRTGDPAAWLRNSALQWQAAIPGDMWMDAMEVIRVTRTWHDGRRDIVLEHAREGTADLPAPTDVYWIIGLDPGGSRAEASGATFEVSPALRSMHLSNRVSDDMLLHALEPLIRRIPAALTQLSTRDDSGHSSVAHSLVRMWLSVGQSRSPEELVAAYEDASDAPTDLAHGKLQAASGDVTELLLGTMRADAYQLPPQTVCGIVHQLMDEAVVTPVAAASAVYCLVASQATRDPYGASLAARLIQEHAASIDGRVLLPALRALVNGAGPEGVGFRALGVALAEAGRRSELERTDPDLSEFYFAEN